MIMAGIVAVFDLDDTLVAEGLFIKSGIRHIARWLSGKFPALKAGRIIGCMEAALSSHSNHYSALERLLKEAGFDEIVDMKEIVSQFRSHTPDPDIYHAPPSTIKHLEKLKNSGIPLILITDGRSITQRNKIKAAGLEKYFEMILISEETGHDKYSPNNFQTVMDRYSEATEFHYTGDNPEKDILQPRLLGWRTHIVHRFPMMIHQ